MPTDTTKKKKNDKVGSSKGWSSHWSDQLAGKSNENQLLWNHATSSESFNQGNALWRQRLMFFDKRVVCMNQLL